MLARKISRKTWIVVAAALIVCPLLASLLYVFTSPPKSTNPQPLQRYSKMSTFDLAFSPDGKMLATTSSTRSGKEIKGLNVAVFNVSDQSLIFENPLKVKFLYPVCFEWSADGSVLIAGGDEKILFYEFDFECDIVSQREVPNNYVSLYSIDQQGNLFGNGIRTQRQYKVIRAPPRIRGSAVAWWNALEDDLVRAEPIGNAPDAALSGVSAVTNGNETRVALAYSDKPKNIPGYAEVLRIQHLPDGTRTFGKPYEIPARSSARIKLTPNGEHVAVTDYMGFRLFRLLPDGSAKMAKECLWRGKEIYLSFDMDDLDVSRDGRFVAYSLTDVIEVIRIEDSATVFKMIEDDRDVTEYNSGYMTEYNRGYAIALSPDGSLLAVSDFDRREVRIHEIPQ